MGINLQQALTAVSAYVQNAVAREIVQEADAKAVDGFEPSKTLEVLEETAKEHGISVLLFAGDEAKAHPDYQEDTDILIEYHALQSDGDQPATLRSQATGIVSHLSLGNGKAITTLDGDRVNNSVFSSDAEHLQSHLEMAIQQYNEHRQNNLQTEQHEAVVDLEPELAPKIATEKTWLAIPFDEKEEAKALAGNLSDGSTAISWDKTAKSWYAKPGTDLAKIKQYLPENVPERQEPALDPVKEFTTACQDAGLIITGKHPIMDGKSHRVPAEGDKKGQTSGEYKGFLDESPAGFIINYRDNYREPWKATGQKLDKATLAKKRAEFQAKSEQRKQEQAEQYETAAKTAQAQWEKMKPVNPEHPYLKKKGLTFSPEFNVRQDERNNLVLPIRNRKGEIRCLQHIWAQGNKQFTTGADKQGCFHVIGSRKALKDQGDKEPLIITTGFATAASIHQATGKPVVVAFNDANLKPVPVALKDAFPNRTQAILGDDDHHLTQRPRKPLANGGKEKANEAANAVGGIAVLPQFKEGPDAERTDFNDLHREEGLEVVKRQVELGLAQARSRIALEQEEKLELEKQKTEKKVLAIHR